MKRTKYYFKGLSLIYFILFITGCSNEEVLMEEGEFEQKEVRVSFSSFEEFNKKIDELSNVSREELDGWMIQNNPNSLFNYLIDNEIEDKYLNNLPEAYTAIFDRNSEISIGEKVIWLNEGSLYEFSKDMDINSSKSDVSNLEAIGEIKIGGIPVISGDNSTDKITLGANGLDARYQREFNGSYQRDCSGNLSVMGGKHYRYKYVHELVTVQTKVYKYGALSRLYLRVKLENKYRRRSWRFGAEKRDIKISLSLPSVVLRNNGRVIPISGSNYVNANYTCSGDRTILLKSTPRSYDIGFSGNRVSWEISVSGTIKQNIHGGWNYWTNYVSW